uniref:Uncharacterized protein n=1 Tax=Escherichia coli TaxID=562 RepID=I3W2B3_ECOLX|nr:hypothetical protein [Escherichia coli]
MSAVTFSLIDISLTGYVAAFLPPNGGFFIPLSYNYPVST